MKLWVETSQNDEKKPTSRFNEYIYFANIWSRHAGLLQGRTYAGFYFMRSEKIRCNFPESCLKQDSAQIFCTLTTKNTIRANLFAQLKSALADEYQDDIFQVDDKHIFLREISSFPMLVVHMCDIK